MKHLKLAVLMMLALALGMGGASTVSAQGPQNFDMARAMADAMIDATLKATRLTEGDLLRELVSGKTFAQVISEQNADLNAVKTDAKALVTEQINAAVQAGTLQRDAANRMLNNLDMALDAMLNQPRPGFGRDLGGLRDRAGQVIHVLRSALEVVAEAIDMTPRDLLREVSTGKTLSQIITEKGGDAEALKAEVKLLITQAIEQAVTDTKVTRARADELLANLDERIDQAFEEKLDMPAGPAGGAGGPAGGRNQRNPQDRLLNTAAASVLIAETARQSNLSQRELLRELRAGKTLREIATAKGADTAKIVADATTVVTDQINNLVRNNRLTREQADQYIGSLPTKLNELMNQKNPLITGMGLPGRRGGRGN